MSEGAAGGSIWISQTNKLKREAEGLGSLEIDRKLELGRLLYRQISRLAPFSTLSFRGHSRRRGVDDDCIRTERNQLQSELVEGFKLVSAKSVLDFEILALNVAQLAKGRL